jgi:antitoxin (DNA-binding transcriptional repressor) of toxin-antitoxin stability system
MKHDYHGDVQVRFRASVTEVLRNFSDYINRVAYRGERFVLTRGGRDVAELAPAPPAGRRLAELPAVLESLPRLGREEATRFAEDLDHGRAVSGGTPAPDQWES